MFTAIVLDSTSEMRAWRAALELGLLHSGWSEKLHHVTLAMGNSSRAFQIGALRALTATHYGRNAGRVTAFRVSGADDSANAVPHLTIAVAPDAKPRESNDIADWVPLAAPFEISGEIKVCE